MCCRSGSESSPEYTLGSGWQGGPDGPSQSTVLRVGPTVSLWDIDACYVFNRSSTPTADTKVDASSSFLANSGWRRRSLLPSQRKVRPPASVWDRVACPFFLRGPDPHRLRGYLSRRQRQEGQGRVGGLLTRSPSVPGLSPTTPPVRGSVGRSPRFGRRLYPYSPVPMCFVRRGIPLGSVSRPHADGSLGWRSFRSPPSPPVSARRPPRHGPVAHRVGRGRAGEEGLDARVADLVGGPTVRGPVAAAPEQGRPCVGEAPVRGRVHPTGGTATSPQRGFRSTDDPRVVDMDVGVDECPSRGREGVSVLHPGRPSFFPGGGGGV